VALVTWIWGGEKAFQGYPLFHVMAGGLALGAFFMATDIVTTPVTPRGKLLFGAGCGVLTSIIRLWGGYPEGVCYSILMMNTAVPLIDRFTRPRILGNAKAVR
jgi:electron transport complex protein RnfD